MANKTEGNENRQWNLPPPRMEWWTEKGKRAMILGLSGPKGSGKSTLAEQLNQQLGYWRFAFADPIKESCAIILRLQGVSEDEIRRLVWGDGKEEECEYFNGKSSRYMQKTLGTKWGRETVDWDLWSGIWERRIVSLRKTTNIYKNIVAEDLRFINEAEVIQRHDGKIIRIERPGLELVDDHISELEYLRIEPDLTIHNSSTPGAMLQKLMEFLK